MYPLIKELVSSQFNDSTKSIRLIKDLLDSQAVDPSWTVFRHLEGAQREIAAAAKDVAEKCAAGHCKQGWRPEDECLDGRGPTVIGPRPS